MKNIPEAILFDLDGTLLDTAPDLVFALNQLRKENGLPDMPLVSIRPIISYGSKEMVKLVLGIEESDVHFAKLRERFLALYQEHLADATQFFPQVEDVIAHIESKNIPWGIVTNKLTRHTHPILEALKLYHRPGCVVCGDTLRTYKPDPAPILHACKLLGVKPENSIYVGDSNSDVLASKAAGSKTLVALYGYIGATENPLAWGADGYLDQPIDMMKWLSF